MSLTVLIQKFPAKVTVPALCSALGLSLGLIISSSATASAQLRAQVVEASSAIAEVQAENKVLRAEMTYMKARFDRFEDKIDKLLEHQQKETK